MTIQEWLKLVDASWYGSSKGMSTAEFYRRQLVKTYPKPTKIVPATLIVDGKEVPVIHAVTDKQMKGVIYIGDKDA